MSTRNSEVSDETRAAFKVSITFTDGTGLLFTGWRAGPGWIILFTEDDRMQAVPYETITDISVQPPGRAPPGFTTLESEPDE